MTITAKKLNRKLCSHIAVLDVALELNGVYLFSSMARMHRHSFVLLPWTALIQPYEMWNRLYGYLSTAQ